MTRKERNSTVGGAADRAGYVVDEHAVAEAILRRCLQARASSGVFVPANLLDLFPALAEEDRAGSGDDLA
jgi:hypothetical protein